jgi:hypothetical protein
MPTQNQHSCTGFWRKSENPQALVKTGELVRLHSTRNIVGQMAEHYIGHHPFHWQRAHVAWQEATCPVLIDFGTDILWLLESYKGQFHCVRQIAKEQVIQDIINESSVQNIGVNYSKAS